MGRWMLSPELLAPVHQAHPYLLPQGPGLHQPLDLVLPEEAESPALPPLKLHLLGELLQ